EFAARGEGGIEQVQYGWRFLEMLRAPGNHLGAPLNVAHGNGQPGATQPHVPGAEQTPTHQAWQYRLAPIDERPRPDDPRCNPQGGGFTLDQLLLQALAPR